MVKNIVVISDTHFGCQLGLCPPEVQLDGGGIYKASKIQMKLWKMWLYFWNDWIPQVTNNEEYAIIINGDVIDGVHHGSKTQISQNIADQIKIAEEVLRPIIKNRKCVAYYHIRGTEAHIGKSGEYEEELAKNLGAIKSKNGNYARWELWLTFGKRKLLCHFTHHISSTNSTAYESTAVHKELVEAYNEAGRWKLRPPDVVVRSHRHRFYLVQMPSSNTNAISVVTPAWQLKTPFVYRGLLGRSSTPQIGGIVIKEGSEVPVYIRHKIWNIERESEERL
jgi:hypothetical protein